jgi:hypothetical protein
MSSYPTSSSASGIWQLGDISLYIQDGAWPTPLFGDLGVFAGGDTPAKSNVIDYVIITSLGNAADFGDLNVGLDAIGGFGSNTRGIIAGGGNTAATGVNTIQYITYASKGNTTNFGNLNSNARVNGNGALSNSTRGIVAGGEGAAPTYPLTNVIDFVTIATTGNATDFGDLLSAAYVMGGTASSTRGVFAGGATPGGQTNVIQYITIASAGNTTDFGDLTTTTRSRVSSGVVSSGTRGVFAGGNVGPLASNVIDFITIASEGNATGFGDLLATTASTLGAGSNSTRGVFGGGNNPAVNNVIQYLTIATTGNTLDFGDLTVARFYVGGLSNANGALS